jgi:2-hydroxyacyl-CoA lyase 1
MCGGKGFLVRTPEELEKATEEGFKAEVPVVVNIIIESGHASKLVSHPCTSSIEFSCPCGTH